MAAQPRNIIVTVVDESSDPLQGATVTLIGGNSPQVLTTEANGECTFSNLPPGQYRLLIAREGFNTRAASVTLTDAADANVRVEMRVVEEETVKKSGFFTFLTGFQYLALAGLAVPFVILLYRVLINPSLDLSKTEAARGMITFVVSTITVGIALFLVLGSAFISGSKDLDKRFAFGKDVFTILVGVLGTVMGFYYGQAATGGANTNTNTNANNQQVVAQTLQLSAPQANPAAPKVNTDFTVTAIISGGEGPFTYSVTFDNPSAITNPAVDVTSDTANISRNFRLANIPTLAGQQIGYTIKATDKNKKTGTSVKGTFTPTS